MKHPSHDAPPLPAFPPPSPPTFGGRDGTIGNSKIDATDLRWDAFSGVAYGYTGHSWFLYQVSPAHKLQPAFFATPGSFTTPRTGLYAIAA